MRLVLGVYYQKYNWQLPLEINARVSIGRSKSDTLTITDASLGDAHMVFVSQNGKCALTAKEGVLSNGSEVHETPIEAGDSFTCGDVSVYISPKQTDYKRSVNLPANRELLIGRSKECSFCLSNRQVSSRHAKILFESGKYKLVDLGSKNHTFVNGAIISTHYLNDGDTISIAYYSMVFENGEISFFNTGDDLKLNLDDKNIVRRYPFFRRSPRFIPAQDNTAIEIEPPPQIGDKPHINWLTVLLPPIVMIAVGVASMLLSGGNIMSLLFVVPMSLVTLLTTAISYFSQVRKFRLQNKRLTQSYEEYLHQKCAEIEAAYNRQLQGANGAHPETQYCCDIVSNQMRRLWERSTTDNDFLDVRVGRGNVPLEANVVFPRMGIGEAINPLLAAVQTEFLRFQTVKDVAVALPIKNSRLLGIIGARKVAERAMRNAMVQLAAHHSYVDVNIIIIAGERDYGQWSWIRWLPHVWDAERRFRYLSSTPKQAHALIDYFEAALKKRLALIKNGGAQKRMALPYLCFLVTDHTLVENRELLGLLAGADTAVGASALLMFDSVNKLPKECDLIIDFNSSGGVLYSKTSSAVKTAFVLDAFDDHEKFARAMAPIRDRLAISHSALPSRVTFFQGYGIKAASEIALIQNWAASRPHKTLAVPIGIRENGKPFLFDLHEKAHGPHGLVAGTTGSGKSEVLQTWILSMCINYSPRDVSFLLIDFKGMGLAGTLKNLPHIAGVISNVDENVQRNLFAIESELSRRQRLFARASTDALKIGDIYDYQEAFQQKKLSEPLSHLIVVVDEFTELKTKFPDFMAAIDRTSRIGRSLGIHLVLATQKPDGAVTDEMRANSNFKWCLRMASEAESRAVIGSGDAASIGKEYPGRAYIQIGNNEVYELVQTFYSGADIAKAAQEGDSVEAAFVGCDGQRERFGAAMRSGASEKEKELLAIVKFISDTHRASGLPAAQKVWEDGLPQRVFLPDIPLHSEKTALAAVIGVTDDPKHQRQYPTVINFTEDGHILIYGAPGTGKTTLLHTLVLSLAERYTPDEVNIYIMDFGSWSMTNLQPLPHVGGVANGNEEEKLFSLSKLLLDILNQRKAQFAKAGAGHFEVFAQFGNRMPAIFVIVDNYAPIREMYPEIEDAFLRISREGGGCGLYIVLSATSVSGNIGYNLTQNFKNALALRMTDKSDYREIVGDPEGLEPSKNAGRGMVRGKPPMEFQTALAVKAENDAQYIQMLKQRCEEIASEWQGYLPREIPVMPEVVLLSRIDAKHPGHIAIGLAYDDIEPVILSRDSRSVLISGTQGSGKTNMLRVIHAQLCHERDVRLAFAQDGQAAAKTITGAIDEAAGGEKITLLIDDLPAWLSGAGYEEANSLERLISDAGNNGFTIIATGDAPAIINSRHTVLNKMMGANASVLLGGSFSEHCAQFEAGNLGYTQQNEQLALYCGYFIQKRKAKLFKAAYGGDGNGI